MKFLTNENIAKSLIKFLRDLGHDVKDVKEMEFFEMPDYEIYALAKRENRAVLSHDKDFINLYRAQKRKVTTIVLSLFDQKPAHVKKILGDFLKEYPEGTFKGRLVIIEETGARVESQKEAV